ncbi:MAG: pilin [Betaproteobacteria bacterium]
MEPQEAARWEAALGRNAKHYLMSFERIRSRGRWTPNWNSAACLHSSAWFCYRRMYGLALLNFFAPVLLFVALAVAGSDVIAAYVLGAYLVGVFLLLPVFADSIYFGRLKDRLERARPPSAWTGLAAGGVVAASIALILMTVTASYGDYSGRAKVSEGILSGYAMRTQVSEFFQEHGRLPAAAEAAKFDRSVASKYVESVAYDAARKAVVVTMRAPFAGKHIELRPVVQADRLVEWRCGSPDLPKKELPGSCRD